MLQWPRYGQLRDTPEVLLAESEETYKFIEKVSPLLLATVLHSLRPSLLRGSHRSLTHPVCSQMISAISGPLRSKRIHIGMDEAHGVSEGRYRQIFGYKDSTQVVSLRFLPPYT
jgi:hypothetical protein